MSSSQCNNYVISTFYTFTGVAGFLWGYRRVTSRSQHLECVSIETMYMIQSINMWHQERSLNTLNLKWPIMVSRFCLIHNTSMHQMDDQLAKEPLQVTCMDYIIINFNIQNLFVDLLNLSETVAVGVKTAEFQPPLCLFFLSLTSCHSR